jgi:hypothetical protein
LLTRRTIYSLLLTILLFLGLRLYTLGRVDDCTPWLHGERGASPTQLIYLGERAVEVPCRSWLPRQPPGILIACLLDAALAVVFLLSCIFDFAESRRRRRPAPSQP